MESQNELREAITSLWSAHLNAKNAAKATKEELRIIRAKLGEQLSEMKQILAKPGRGGQWSSFLQERGIPRATADRLVGHYEQSINPDANRPSEAISEPTEEEVQRLFISVWPKLRRTLRSRRSLFLFIDLLTSHYESSEVGDREITVLAPAPPTICPASSDGGSFDEPEVNAAALVARVDDEVI
jgi:hypothetical protein